MRPLSLCYDVPMLCDLPTTHALFGGRDLTMLSNSDRKETTPKCEGKSGRHQTSAEWLRMPASRYTPDALETSLRLGPPAILFMSCLRRVEYVRLQIETVTWKMYSS